MEIPSVHPGPPPTRSGLRYAAIAFGVLLVGFGLSVSYFLHHVTRRERFIEGSFLVNGAPARNLEVRLTRASCWEAIATSKTDQHGAFRLREIAVEHLYDAWRDELPRTILCIRQPLGEWSWGGYDVSGSASVSLICTLSMHSNSDGGKVPTHDLGKYVPSCRVEREYESRVL